MYKFYCDYCEQTFEFEKKQQWGAHRRNCSKNPNKKRTIRKSGIKKIYNIQCQGCNKLFEQPISAKAFNEGRYGKFCTDCSELKEKECLNCNKEFKPNTKIQKFCNTKCCHAYTNREYTKREREKSENKKIEIRVCPTCNESFECEARLSKKFCSFVCAGSYGGKIGIRKSSKRSKNEILFSELCNEYFTNISLNEKYFNGWDADIILKNEEIAILWNGNWHYKKITKDHSLLQVQNRDKLKMKEIRKIGFYPLVIKDPGRYNPIFVKEQFDGLIRVIELIKNIFCTN